MQSYRLLFSVDVGHGYFVDGKWRQLVFRSPESCRRAMTVSGAVLKAAGNRLNVYFLSDRCRAMRMLADETGGEFSMVVGVTARDRGFRNYTDLGKIEPGHLLCFGNAGLPAEALAGRLSQGETASAKDARPVQNLLADGIVAARDLRDAPDFILDIRLAPDSIEGGAPPHFTLGFANRDLFWNYYLLGALNRENLFIVDLDERVEFVGLEDEFRVADRPARVFRSTTVLPVLEKSSLRLQLRERGNGSGKVLVKRLPVASNNFGRQEVDGVERLVSNLFVNY